MKRICQSVLIILLCGLFSSLYAQQSGGGSGGGLKDTCEISGGTFTGSEGGNWACCWADWGCYGCVDSNCKMKCTTKRCRKANGMSVKLNDKEIVVDGLAAPGLKAPVAPKKPTKATVPSSSTNNVKN